eukprot:scaffold377_cov269-Pinguiococcus_pyrenoidosus.AAC.5
MDSSIEEDTAKRLRPPLLAHPPSSDDADSWHDSPRLRQPCCRLRSPCWSTPWSCPTAHDLGGRFGEFSPDLELRSASWWGVGRAYGPSLGQSLRSAGSYGREQAPSGHEIEDPK